MTYDIDKVTPRPWHIDPWHGNSTMPTKVTSWCIEADADDPDDMIDTIGEIYGPDEEQSEANAAHIVHCVNYHESLVQSVSDLLRVVEKNAPNLYENGILPIEARLLLEKVKV